MSNNNNKWLLPALVGGVVGLAIGLLFSNYQVKQVEVIQPPNTRKKPFGPYVSTIKRKFRVQQKAKR